MTKSQLRICANCKHWNWFDVNYEDKAEDACGSCPKNDGEVVYGDDAACDMFEADKKVNVRSETYRG